MTMVTIIMITNKRYDLVIIWSIGYLIQWWCNDFHISVWQGQEELMCTRFRKPRISYAGMKEKLYFDSNYWEIGS